MVMPNEIKRTNKGFMSYTSMLNKYRQLTMEEFYNLYWAVADYTETGNIAKFEDRFLNSLYEDWINQVNIDFQKYNDKADKNAEYVAKYRAKQKEAPVAKKDEEVSTYTSKEEKVSQNEEKGYSEPIINNVPAPAHNKTVENTFQAPIGNKKPDVEIYDSAKLKEKEYEVLKNDISYMLKKYPETEEEVLVNRMHNIHNIAKEDVIRCLEEIKSKNQ